MQKKLHFFAFFAFFLVMGRARKSRVRASPSLKTSSPIESESWLFQKNRVRVGQKMPSQSQVDAESSLGPITSETFWVWASPSLKKSSPIDHDSSSKIEYKSAKKCRVRVESMPSLDSDPSLL